MYSKLVNTLLGRHKSKPDLAQCKSQPGPAHDRTQLNPDDPHLSADGASAPTPPTSTHVRQPSFTTAAGHALLLDDCQMIDHAPCPKCTRATDNYEVPDMRQHFALSWNVRYLGSFPISNTTPEHVSSRLENFQVPPTSKPVTLSVSLLGVRVHNKENVLVMSHSLRRVCSVIGRAHLRQVAYTAMEAAGQTYRRQCHVFQTDDIHQVEEIESVLGNAFQAALVSKTTTPARPVTMATPLPVPSLSKSDKRCSSTAFMARLLGKGKETIEDKTKRKRRPVSAVFSSAIHRLSSTTSIANKRMSSVESPPRKDLRREEFVAKATSPVPEEPLPPKEKKPAEPVLVYDEKLGEWIYPIDETLQAQLENVNYFVKLPSRELLVRNLLSQCEGAFVVRYSESKRRCLALSVRVPPTHNPACISHYLIIRNQSGYRIKSSDKHFPSLQMLITHHSVMPEKLPVALVFVQWNPSDWVEKYDLPQAVPSEEKRHSYTTAHTKYTDTTDENRNSKYYHDHERRIEDYVTPKRRSRIYLDSYRHSRLIDIA
ncbi:unnamed protein product [Cylicocyclus nassatus]|uniref:SH2 domain-containing protein n=1 Tax=Cylicocyclus nassatus TaxID=53992 RepID=A0AA36H720_CYLNA|nr:unnamed protein product [Cylicocyclus nassatus]